MDLGLVGLVFTNVFMNDFTYVFTNVFMNDFTYFSNDAFIIFKKVFTKVFMNVRSSGCRPDPIACIQATCVPLCFPSSPTINKI